MRKPKVQQRTERRISAALRLVMVAVLLLAQIALVIVLSDLLKQRMALAYTVLQLLAGVVAMRIWSRPGATSYKMGWIILVLFVPVVWLFYKLFKLKPVNQLGTIIFAFIFLAYTIGEVLAGYYWIPHFDKVCHALSGTFTGILGIIMYYVLKPGRRMERGDFAACTVFMLCFAMAIAGMWEIGEFTISLVTDLDPQWVEGTGVTDTMTDMIACLIGALALIPSLTIFYKKNRADVIMGAVESFCELNLNGGK